MTTHTHTDWRLRLIFVSGFALIGFLMADASGLIHVSDVTHDAAVRWLLSR